MTPRADLSDAQIGDLKQLFEQALASPADQRDSFVVEACSGDLHLQDELSSLLDAHDVNGVAAYGGFPTRYPSWRFGMEFERLEKTRQYGLSRIYELVINTEPVVAYLVKTNSHLEQKLVIAHVCGHADFFKHNSWFASTDRG